MTRSIWFWFLVGWLFSLLFSPKHVTGMFAGKASS